MNDEEELASFRAENEESLYVTSHIIYSDSEVQKRWSEWFDLLLKQQRRVQGGATIQEIWR